MQAGVDSSPPCRGRSSASPPNVGEGVRLNYAERFVVVSRVEDKIIPALFEALWYSSRGNTPIAAASQSYCVPLFILTFSPEA